MLSVDLSGLLRDGHSGAHAWRERASGEGPSHMHARRATGEERRAKRLRTLSKGLAQVRGPRRSAVSRSVALSSVSVHCGLCQRIPTGSRIRCALALPLESRKKF